tara:strand:+ start:30793 stop:31224 length:432 start_codon:yes stop_codon:yes gene_type:complete
MKSTWSMFFSTKTLPLMAVFVTACGGGLNWQAPPAMEQLIPEITEDGTKFFTFQRDYLNTQQSGPPGTDRNANREPRRRDVMTGEFEVTERVQAILDLTGYCREGFFERHREQTFRRFLIKGECREAASVGDREMYTAPIALN